MPPSLHRRRSHEHRVLAWSIGTAAVLHVAVFVLWPLLRTEALEVDSGISLAADSAAAVSSTRLDLFFGPPTIRSADGSEAREPETRFLEAVRYVQIFGPCPVLFDPDRMPVRATVGLVLNASGLVDSARIVAGTAEPCTDALAVRVAGDLLYEWLPSDRFPAPGELVQPVMIREASR